MSGRRRRGNGRGIVMLKNNRGYTLPELIVVMAIFIIVMVVTSNGFNTVLKQVGKQSKMMETDIGNVIGLEQLRSDLQNAGYGLPWVFQASPSTTKYVEVATGDSGMPISAGFWEAGITPRSFNDATGGVPRAVQSADTTFNEVDGVGSKYLVLKSLSVAPGNTQKKYVTVTYSDTAKSASQWNSADRDFETATDSTERVMVIRNTFIDGVPSRLLQVDSANGTFAAAFKNYTTLTQPHSSGDVFQVYGIDATGSDPRMPFNRADYYVNRPSNISPAYAPNTGVLYKAVLNHSGGFKETALLDCVADMQVVYGVGPAGTPDINFHQTTPPGTGSAKDIREQLKEIRLYILGHEGKKDTGFSQPNPVIKVGENFSGVLLGRNFDLSAVIGADWSHYRWKLYTIVVRPQNLIQ